MASRSGNDEKLTTASHANRIMRLGEYFVSPAPRSARSYSTNDCRYPAQRASPRRKRCRSGIATSTSTTRRDM
ncbi:MAG TPA: hypothetical protein VFA56_05455 [Gaiellaceae bacterium]|nr:hypothetical protein [Gaiellaceae bacterium]